MRSVGNVRLIAASVMAATAIVAAGCGSAGTSSAAASKPTKLVFYSAQGYDQAEATAFQKATGIKVELDDMSTGPLLAKVTAEGAHPKWDVIWFDGNGPMASLDSKGMLLHGYNPKNLTYYDKLGQSLLPKDHAYFPTGVTAAAAIAYNKKAVPTPPQTWAQLLGPAYKNKVGMNNPAISGPTYPFVASIFKVMGVSAGKQFYLSMKKNGLKIFSTNGDTLKALETGAINIAMVQDSAIISAMQKDPSIGIAYPTTGVAMLPSDMAVSKNGPDRKAAEMFVNFVLSRQGQHVMSTEGGGDSLYQPILTDAVANPKRPTVPVQWINVNPVSAGRHEAAWVKWFTQNIVQ